MQAPVENDCPCDKVHGWELGVARAVSTSDQLKEETNHIHVMDFNDGTDKPDVVVSRRCPCVVFPQSGRNERKLQLIVGPKMRYTGYKYLESRKVLGVYTGEQRRTKKIWQPSSPMSRSNSAVIQMRIAQSFPV